MFICLLVCFFFLKRSISEKLWSVKGDHSEEPS